MAVGGSIIEVTFNHPTLGTGVFYPKADEDSTFDPGGYRSADDSAAIDGSGESIRTMTKGRWSFETTISNDMNSRKDLEKLVQLASDPVEANWTMASINGTVYAGKGAPVGDISASGKDSVIKLKLSGSGTLAQI